MGIKEKVGLFFAECAVLGAAEGRVPDGTNTKNVAGVLYRFKREELSAIEAVNAAQELGRIEGWLGEYIIRKEVALNPKSGDGLSSFGAWLRSDLSRMRHAQRNGVIVNKNRHLSPR